MIKVLYTIVLVVMLVGCGGVSADKKDAVITNQQQEVYQVKQPLPFFGFSHEREIVTQIYEARNDAVSTWSVWRWVICQ